MPPNQTITFELEFHHNRHTTKPQMFRSIEIELLHFVPEFLPVARLALEDFECTDYKTSIVFICDSVGGEDIVVPCCVGYAAGVDFMFGRLETRCCLGGSFHCYVETVCKENFGIGCCAEFSGGDSGQVKWEADYFFVGGPVACVRESVCLEDVD